MEIDQTIRELNEGHHLLDLTRILGLDCLQNRHVLANELYEVGGSDASAALVATAAEASQSMWHPDGSFLREAPVELYECLRMLRSTPELATAKLLAGICIGAAAIHFAYIEDTVVITRGSVLPLPSRRLAAPATPNPATALPDLLLDRDCGFSIWRDDDWSVELDYAHRERLTQICWSGGGDANASRLPRVATIHPFSGDEIVMPALADGGRFFGAYPDDGHADGSVSEPPCPSGPWDGPHGEVAGDHRRRMYEARVMEPLRRAARAGAVVAVLPELSLHAPDALAELLRESAEPLPPLIVAGTAHNLQDGQRANTSVTYIDGQEALRTHKFNAFHFTATGTPIDEQKSSAPPRASYREDIAPQPMTIRVLASTDTRLAVAVCADLNAPAMQAALIGAGVNLLLVPAWTPKVGFFEGALAGLAAYTQCAAVIANAPGHPAADPTPFWTMSRTPHEGAQCETHSPDSEATGTVPAVGIFDLNMASAQGAPHAEWL